MYGGGYQQVLQDKHRGLTMQNYVNGGSRSLYFKRPLVPQLSDVPLHLSQPSQEVMESVPQNQ